MGPKINFNYLICVSCSKVLPLCKFSSSYNVHHSLILFLCAVHIVLLSPDETFEQGRNQRWSPGGRPCPRGHILKSLASKVKSLASKPQVFKNWLVLGSRTALFFEPLKFCWKTPETSRKICKHLFCLPQLEHRCSQRGGEDQGTRSPQLKFHRWQKCAKKAYCFFSFSSFLAFFACNSN